MRITPTLLIAAGLIIPPILSYAQKDLPTNSTDLSQTISSKISDLSFFEKGNWQYDFRKIIGAGYMNNYQDDKSTGHQDQLNLDMGVNYCFIPHFALGVEINLGLKDNYEPGSNNTSNKWMISPDLEYGLNLCKSIGIFARGSVGFGSNSVVDKGSITSSSTKSNTFGAGLTVGVPILLSEEGAVCLTPQISYNYNSTSLTGERETYGGLSIGVGFQTFLSGCDYQSDCHNGFSHSRYAYQAGASFFDFTTSGNLLFGTDKTNYSSGGYSTSMDQENNNRYRVGIDYGIYVFNYIAVALGVGISGNTTKDKFSDYSTDCFEWCVTPKIEIHLPSNNGWDNGFVQFGAGIAASTETDNTGTSTTTTKYNKFNYFGKLGYNEYIAPQISITPMIGYGSNNSDETITDTKKNSSGLLFDIGIRYSF
jgi:hypothetical protein